MSRRVPNPGEDSNVEWAQAQLDTGEGLTKAVEHVDAIIHTASSVTKHDKIDVDGTRLLLEHARQTGAIHFTYISIVGIEQISFSYYQSKLAAERLIEASGMPYTILRATQFHSFIDRLLQVLTRLPLAFVPTDWQFQLIDDGEVADHLVAAVRAGPAGRLPDIGGPEVLGLKKMAREWLAVQGKRRLVIHLPMLGKLSAGFRQGLNTTPHNAVGKITWSEWARAKYAGTDYVRPKR
jgi:uncharacterized protein YbjT (DUF2867 family)